MASQDGPFRALGGEGGEAPVKTAPVIRRPRSRYARQRSFLLFEVMVYVGLLVIILGLAYRMFFEALAHHRHLAATTTALVTALEAGEQWRADVRASLGGPQLLPNAPRPTWQLQKRRHTVQYALDHEAILRRVLPKTNWLVVVTNVIQTRMQIESRSFGVVARWDLELRGYRPSPLIKPVFSFLAVPQPSARK